MSIPVRKRWQSVFGIACIGLLLLNACLIWNNASLSIRVAFAGEQMQIFEEMHVQAVGSDVAGAVSCLEYVIGYYPSGTKQTKGSRLDGMVERHRALAVREIIAHVNNTAGEKLGDSPEAWIQKYGRR